MRHAPEVKAPIEFAFSDDPDLYLAWAPLIDIGWPCEYDACEDVCTCQEEDE